ncbi:16065_t:CDS:2, partial [Dentiscutata heterogama]
MSDDKIASWAGSVVISTSVSIVLGLYSTYSGRNGWYKNNGKLSIILAIVVPLISLIGLVGMCIGVNDDIDRLNLLSLPNPFWPELTFFFNTLHSFIVFIIEEWIYSNCTNYSRIETYMSLFLGYPMLERYADNMGMNKKDILKLVRNRSNEDTFRKMANKYQISVEELKNRLNSHGKVIVRFPIMIYVFIWLFVIVLAVPGYILVFRGLVNLPVVYTQWFRTVLNAVHLH